VILTILHSPIFLSACVGFITAAVVDLHAWKSWGDVAFNIKTASFRWVIGTIFGALAGAGYKQF
jgi:hypothetical protein